MCRFETAYRDAKLQGGYEGVMALVHSAGLPSIRPGKQFFATVEHFSALPGLSSMRFCPQVYCLKSETGPRYTCCERTPALALIARCVKIYPAACKCHVHTTQTEAVSLSKRQQVYSCHCAVSNLQAPAGLVPNNSMHQCSCRVLEVLGIDDS